MDYSQKALDLHKKLQWKIETKLKTPIENLDDLSTVYSPWVGAPCLEISKDRKNAYIYTSKANTVAVVSDGSAVLGLWNIWAEAALPVMEWKCALFKQFGWLNAVPIVLDTQNTEEIITIVKNIAPTFWGINLEDISAPRCFEIEERLKAETDIPVFHDDQHGTAIVVLAWIINSLHIVKKQKESVKVVINGVGAAGVAITNLLIKYGIKNIVVVDSSGTIYKWREKLNPTKEMLTNVTNTACILDPNGKWCIKWGLEEAVKETDIFIWVSAPEVLSVEMVQTMNDDAIIFALANPVPEIWPDDAYAGGAKIVATGRSDLPNQVNNSLVFPGIFAGALKNRVENITDDMKISAAEALAAHVKEPTVDKIIPWAFEPGVAELIAESIV